MPLSSTIPSVHGALAPPRRPPVTSLRLGGLIYSRSKADVWCEDVSRGPPNNGLLICGHHDIYEWPHQGGPLLKLLPEAAETGGLIQTSSVSAGGNSLWSYVRQLRHQGRLMLQGGGGDKAADQQKSSIQLFQVHLEASLKVVHLSPVEDVIALLRLVERTQAYGKGSGRRASSWMPPKWVDAYANSILLRLVEFTLPQMTQVVQLLASLRKRPYEEWLQACVGVVVEQLQTTGPMSAQEIVAFLGALEGLPGKVPAGPVDQVGMLVSSLQPVLSGLEGDRLCDLMRLMGHWKLEVGEAWWDAYWIRLYEVKVAVTADQWVMMCRGMAALSLKPTLPWRAELVDLVMGHVEEFSVDELEVVLCSLSTITSSGNLKLGKGPVRGLHSHGRDPWAPPATPMSVPLGHDRTPGVQSSADQGDLGREAATWGSDDSSGAGGHVMLDDNSVQVEVDGTPGGIGAEVSAREGTQCALRPTGHVVVGTGCLERSTRLLTQKHLTGEVVKKLQATTPRQLVRILWALSALDARLASLCLQALFSLPLPLHTLPRWAVSGLITLTQQLLPDRAPLYEVQLTDKGGEFGGSRVTNEGASGLTGGPDSHWCDPGGTPATSDEESVRSPSVQKLIQECVRSWENLEEVHETGPPSAPTASANMRLAATLQRCSPEDWVNLLLGLVNDVDHPPRAWTGQILTVMSRHLHHFNSYQLSTVAWCASRLTSVAPPEFLSGVMAASSGSLDRFSPTALSTLILAVAQLAGPGAGSSSLTVRQVQVSKRMTNGDPIGGLEPSIIMAWRDKCLAMVELKMYLFNARALTNSLAALVQLSHLPGPGWMTTFFRAASGLVEAFPIHLLCASVMYVGRLYRHENHPMEDIAGLRGWMDAAIMQISRSLQMLSGREVVMVVTGCEKLRYSGNDQGWLEGYLNRLRQVLSQLEPQDFSNLMNSLVKLKHSTDQDFLARMLTAIDSQWSQFTPKDLTRMLDAFSAWGWHPGDVWMRRYCKSCLSCLSDYGSWDLVGVLCGLVSLRVTPWRGWVECWEEQVISKLPDFTGEQLGSLLWARAKLSLSCSGDFVPLVYRAAEGHLPSCTPATLAKMMWAAVKLKYKPEHDWVARMEEVLWAKGAQCNDQTISMLTYAYAMLRVCPGPGLLPHFMCQVMELAVQRRLCAQALTVTLWSFTAMHYTPTTAWLHRITSLIHQQMLLTFTLRDIQLLLASLGHFGHAPPEPFVKMCLVRASMCIQEGALPEVHGGTFPKEPTGEYIPGMLRALWVLRYVPEGAWLDSMLRRIQQDAPHLSPAAVTAAMYSSARGRWPLSREFISAMLLSSHRSCGAYSPKQLATLLWAVGECRINPGPRWLQRVLMEFQGESHGFTPPVLCLVLRSLTQLPSGPSLVRILPWERWLRGWQPSSGDLAKPSARDLAVMTWALAKLDVYQGDVAVLIGACHEVLQGMTGMGVRAVRRAPGGTRGRTDKKAAGTIPPVNDDRGKPPQMSWDGGERFSVLGLMLVLWGVARFYRKGQQAGSLELPGSWMQSYWEASLPLMKEGSPVHLSNILWSCAHMATKKALPPKAWLESWYSEFALRLGEGDSGALLKGLWAVAKLRLSPGPTWVKAVVEALHPMMSRLNTEDLVVLLWCCARLRFNPSREWMNDMKLLLDIRSTELTASLGATAAWAMKQVEGRRGPGV